MRTSDIVHREARDDCREIAVPLVSKRSIHEMSAGSHVNQSSARVRVARLRHIPQRWPVDIGMRSFEEGPKAELCIRRKVLWETGGAPFPTDSCFSEPFYECKVQLKPKKGSEPLDPKAAREPARLPAGAIR